jgi:hypothetical protein
LEKPIPQARAHAFSFLLCFFPPKFKPSKFPLGFSLPQKKIPKPRWPKSLTCRSIPSTIAAGTAAEEDGTGRISHPLTIHNLLLHHLLLLNDAVRETQERDVKISIDHLIDVEAIIMIGIGPRHLRKERGRESIRGGVV